MDYTVLVVEDEENQRRTLVQKVDWASAGFRVVGEAENGVEALDLVETLEPDLIITDIKMPMISGLELAAGVRKMRPATQVVILSGYDSFEYARTAINYNIIRYLLKPISSAELTEELGEIRRRMDERLGSLQNGGEDLKAELRRLQISEFLLPLMLDSAPKQKDEQSLFKKAAELSVIDSDEDSRYCVLVTKFQNENGEYKADSDRAAFCTRVISRYMHCVSVVVYGRIATLVSVQGEALDNALELPLRELVQTAKRVFHENATVGVSREFSALLQCSAAYLQAVTARRYTSDGAGQVRFINDQEHGEDEELDTVEQSVLKLEQLLKVGKREALSEYVSTLYDSTAPDNANLLVVQMIAAVCRVVGTVSDKTELHRLIESNPLVARINTYSNENEMRRELTQFCEQAKDIIAQSQRRDSEVLCDRVITMINEQYGNEELSLTNVSSALAVSPNYLSTLIKKTTGKNFVTLLTDRRMRAAYDMLICSPMKILEITEKCGYTDQHYFSYCFKKFYGESPAKVRELHRS